MGVSARWAFLFFFFGLLIDYAYRAIVRHENALDLVALVLGGSVISGICQARHKVLGKTYLKVVALFAVLGVVFGVIISMMQAIQAR
jgi:hypothetical protein